MPSKTGQIYEFDSFRLDPLKRLLTRAGQSIALPGKALEILTVLVERAAQPTTKEQLLEAVWPGITVEENNLTVHISSLRKALGESPGEGRYIVTIAGRGYQFVAPVRVVESEPVLDEPFQTLNVQPARGKLLGRAAAVVSLALIAFGIALLVRNRAPMVAPAVQSRAIAILPFKLIGTAPEDDYLTLGLTDALITRLSRVPGLRVRPTDAVVQYRNGSGDPVKAGHELRVGTLVQGEIQRLGSGVHVAVQLVSAKDGTTLWSDKFDTDFTTLFALEDTISEAVAGQLSPRLSEEDRRAIGRKYTSSAAAHEQYLKGRYFWSQDTEEALRKSLAYFERAVELDPKYSLARAAAAESYIELVLQAYDSSEKALPKAKQAASIAQERDPALAEPYAVLGFVAWAHDWDWKAADAEFRKAQALDPDSATVASYYAFELASAGNFEEALMQVRHAVELDPISLGLTSQMAYLELLYRHPREAETWARQALELNPGPLFARAMLIAALSLQDKHAEAMAEYDKIPTGALTSSEQLATAYAAFACGRAGRSREAGKLLNEVLRDRQHRYLDPYLLAAIAGSAGDHNAEWRWLKEAFDQRSMSMVLLGVDPFFESLRGREPMRTMAEQVGLPFSR